MVVIIHKQYLAILNSGYKMVIENKEHSVDFIEV